MPIALKPIKIFYKLNFNYKAFCFFVGYIFFFNSLFSQSSDYKIGVLNNESNIVTNNVVSSVHKDDKGFLWIGKMDGLFKYNGYDFKVYANTFGGNLGLSNPWVTDVNEIENHIIVGTKNGLNLLNQSTETFQYIYPADYNSNLSNHVTTLNILNNNKIQVGLTNGLLQVNFEENNSFKVEEIKFENSKNTLENPFVHKVITIKEGSLIQTSNNIFLLEPNNTIAKKIKIEKPDGSILKGFDTIFLLNEDTLIVSYKGEAYYINTNKNYIHANYLAIAKPITEIYPSWPSISKINNIFKDSSDTLWIGTEGAGLYFYHKQSGNWQNFRYKVNYANVLKNDFIRVIDEDKSGMLIVGSDAGINVIYNKQNKFHIINNVGDVKNGKSDIVNVHGILEDENQNLWVGTRGKGLFVFADEFENNITPDVNNSLSQIRSIIEDKEGDIWLGTQNGIHIISKDKKKRIEKLSGYFNNRKPDYLIGEHIYAILEDNVNNKWISTGNGLYVLNNDNNLKKVTNTSIGTSLDYKIIYSMMLDSSDRIWFGTLNGMIAYLDSKDYEYPLSIYSNTGKPLDFKLVRVAKEFKEYFQNYETYSFCEVGSKEIYVGTNFGLCKIDLPKKELTPLLSLNKSLDSVNVVASYVYGLLFDEANNIIWGSSNNGLFAYNFNNKDLQRFGIKDGLQSLEFNGNSVFNGKSGHLYFGGANGLNSYKTSVSLTKSDYKPNLVLTKLFVNGKQVGVNDETKILNKEVSFTKDIELKAKENTIGLEFASLHLPYSTNNLYKCKLIGVDEDWRYLGNKRSINYANLPKGDYEFRLKGSNNDGVWNTEELSLNITVLPAWYAIWWVMLLWYILGVFIVVAFIIIILKNRDNINELKIKEIEQIKTSEIYESKLVLFTNISHELRTPLSLILDPVQSLIQQKKTYHENKDLFDIIKNNVERLKRLIDQVMDFRKHEYGKIDLKITKSNIAETLASISSSFVYHSELKNIKYNIKLPDNPMVMYYDIDKIEKIVYNILSNAFKATKNGGKIRISLGEFDANRKLHKLLKYKVISGTKDLSTLNNHIYIKIVDNGEGIHEDNLEEIFTRFYQDNTINSGTGIGLYMVKQLTEMHYGNILIKSTKKKGTSFIIILPKNEDLYKPLLNDAEKIDEIEVEKPVSLPILTNEVSEVLQTKRYTIVIVEDNDELRMYLKSILKAYYNVYTANNGLEGLMLIQEEIPDVVISDIVMPEIDGLELCKRIKNNFDTSHIPVILLTAKSFDYQIIDGAKSGADIYLTKPFNGEILIANINNLISNREKLRLIFQNENILEPSKITVTSIDEQFIEKLKKAVEENIQDQQLTLEFLATQVGVSRAQLFRKVKALTGLTPNNFIKSIRIKFAAELLKDERFQMSEIAFLSGFKEASYFSRCFKETYGCSPKEYKKSL